MKKYLLQLERVLAVLLLAAAAGPSNPKPYAHQVEFLRLTRRIGA